MQNKISAKGRAYALVAPLAADAFIIHAEGNEPDNENTADVLSGLEMAAILGAQLIGAEKAEALKNMAYSMLQDKSQYGVAERENVTNDLTLRIKLPEIPTAIKTLKTQPSTQQHVFYNLQGMQIPHPTKGLYIRMPEGQVTLDK